MHEVIRVVHPADGDEAGGAEWDALERAVRESPAAAEARRLVVGRPLPGSLRAGRLMVRLGFAGEEQWRRHRADFDALLRDAGAAPLEGAEFGDDGPGAAGRRRDAVTGSAADQAPGADRAPDEDQATGAPVYRALLLRVAPGTGDAALAEFERDLLSMPRHIRSIRAWRLGRVDGSVGPTPWTHVWEQEYTDAAAVTGEYLEHPVHWAVVDRWFDPECPESIVRDRVCHAFCPLGRPVVG